MDLLKVQSKKGAVALGIKWVFDVVYVALVALSIIFLGYPWVAIGLVIISKWRMLFVRPRFWWANLLANLTDIIFGLGMVTLIWLAPVLWLQLVWAAAYLGWIILLKPQSKRPAIIAQSMIAEFVGIWGLLAVAQYTILPVVLVSMFVIGFAVARHILADYEEDSRSLLAMFWGVVMAELGFLGFHWTLAYEFFGVLFVPQAAILAVLLSTIMLACYDSYSKNEGKIKWGDIRWPVVFSTMLIVVIAVIFSGLL
jgi:hypothetical protein